jgi:anti-sigma factor RsiW
MTPDEHLDEELSAYLDGGLTTNELTSVQAHLDGCASCRDELEAERRVRNIVRGLPPVEPPFGFYERLLRSGLGELSAPTATVGGEPGKPKRRFKFGLANLVATAAVWLLILALANVNSGHGTVSPSVSNYVTAHASLVPGFGRASGGVSSDAQHEAQTHNVPDRLAGEYDLVGVQDEGGTPQLVYSNGDTTLSMFLRPGELDVSALPDGAEQVSVNGAPAWSVPTAEGVVVFVQRPGIVVVIVGQVPTDAASEVASGPTPRAGSPSIGDRLESAGRALLQSFGLRG